MNVLKGQRHKGARGINRRDKLKRNERVRDIKIKGKKKEMAGGRKL